MKNVVLLVFFWGLFLALWQLVWGININAELGQHYLTVSMPIGAALAISLRFLFIADDKFFHRFFFFVSFAVIILSLSTLLSRSVFVFNILILLLFLIYFMFFSASVSLKAKTYAFLSMFMIFFIVSFYIWDLIEFRQLYRIMQLLEDTSEEPRYATYLRTLTYIADTPLAGHGLNSYNFLTGRLYPHNIFLEILFFGGFLLLLPFLLLVVFYIKCLNAGLKLCFKDPYIFGSIGMSIFFFLQFNTSFSLSGSYIAIGAIVLFIVGFSEYRLYKGVIYDNRCYTNT
jgi:O-antigen ligase